MFSLKRNPCPWILYIQPAIILAIFLLGEHEEYNVLHTPRPLSWTTKNPQVLTSQAKKSCLLHWFCFPWSSGFCNLGVKRKNGKCVAKMRFAACKAARCKMQWPKTQSHKKHQQSIAHLHPWHFPTYHRHLSATIEPELHFFAHPIFFTQACEKVITPWTYTFHPQEDSKHHKHPKQHPGWSKFMCWKSCAWIP